MHVGCGVQGSGFKFSGKTPHTYILRLSQSRIYILLKKIKIVKKKKKEIKVQITKKVHHIATINPVKEKCRLYPLLWVFIGCFS